MLCLLRSTDFDTRIEVIYAKAVVNLEWKATYQFTTPLKLLGPFGPYFLLHKGEGATKLCGFYGNPYNNVTTMAKNRLSKKSSFYRRDLHQMWHKA